MDDTVGDHDRLNFYAWVDKKKDKKVEKRLLVVTDHRLLSIKRKVTGNKTVCSPMPRHMVPSHL